MGKKMHEITQRHVLGEREIENPLATDALVDAAIEDGEERPRWMSRIVNRATLIGGLARMKGLTPVQLAAGEWWRSKSDSSLIGGARAIDYEAVRVDVSGGGKDVVEDGAMARRDLAIARRHLGPFHSSLLDRVICEENSVRDVARADGAAGGSGRLLTTRRVIAALDALVGHLAKGRRGLRVDGDAAHDWSLPQNGVAEPPKAH